jgi:hypothetical protein
MNKAFLMVRDIDQVILGVMWHDDPEDGPVLAIQAQPPEGVSLVRWTGDFERADYPETYVASFINGEIKWADGEDFSAQRARKATAIEQACGNAIVAGFPCDALGAGYFYPAKPNDQANLTGSVLRSFYLANGPDWRTPFWCADAEGVWKFRPHTAAQIQHVGDCAMAARLHCMGINERLQSQIIAAENPADLADINWPE